MQNNDALTAEDVAAMLQISKSSVYKLVKSDELASYYVGRKLRFTSADVENYIARSRQAKAREVASASGARVAGAHVSATSSVVGPRTVASRAGTASLQAGAHDTLSQSFVLAGNDIVGDIISNYLGAMGVPVERIYEGSYNALVDVYRGKAHAALSHLYDGATNSYNTEGVRRLLPGVPCATLRLVGRRQGLIVAKGNPKNLRTWDDILRPGVRLINRERGCGSRILLDEQLVKRGVGASARQNIEGYAREAKSGLAMASFVARGAADVGIAVERVYHQVEGVDFISLQDEWLDLVIAHTPVSASVAESIVKLLKTKPFQEEVGRIIGYNVTQMGKLV